MFIPLLFIICIGLAMGSFINALVYRISRNESIVAGRSKCPACRHQLAWFDLVPLISFFFLRGQCRYCHREISLQYPLVEFITAGSLACLYLVFGNSANFLFFAMVVLFLIPLFFADALYYIVPDSISIPAIVIVLAIQFFRGADMLHIFYAMMIGGGLFLFQYLFSKGRWVGEGDIRIGILMGAILGIPQILVALFIAYVGGAFLGFILIASGHKQMSSRVPFATLLTVATFITMLFGNSIINFYLQLAGFR